MYSFLQPNQLRPKVLHEAEGHIVTIETTSGEVFVTFLLDDLYYSSLGNK